MTGWQRWFLHGREVKSGDSAITRSRDIVSLLQGRLGTELRWNVHAANVSSLLHVASIMEDCPAPFILRFFASGWFEETYGNVAEASTRIADLVAHGDRFLPSRIFVKEADPDPAAMPEVLAGIMRKTLPYEAYAVSCRYEQYQDGFVVASVGEKSIIATIWGTEPNSWPCRNAGALGASANRSYERAIKRGNPVYEHVVASFQFPDGSLRWVPYHRLILPVQDKAVVPEVAVVSECAKVSFRVL